MQDELQRRVAANIRVELTRQQMTAERLARLLNVSPPWVSRRMTGKQKFSRCDVGRVADALNVRVERLLGVRDTESAPEL